MSPARGSRSGSPVPSPVWGRDELRTGDMWNSNSVIACLLARGGLPATQSVPWPVAAPQDGSPAWSRPAASRAGTRAGHESDEPWPGETLTVVVRRDPAGGGVGVPAEVGQHLAGEVHDLSGHLGLAGPRREGSIRHTRLTSTLDRPQQHPTRRSRPEAALLIRGGTTTLPEERHHAAPVADGRHLSLRADCQRCFGLCCVAPAFSASADFAIDKPAGQPCPNLRSDFRCAIHHRLRQEGFPGCSVYDCFGAGQKVAQVTFGGRDWRQAPRTAKRMFEVFTIMRQLHELLWYLTEALTLQPARPLHGALRRALDKTERLTHGSPEHLVELDVRAHRRDVNALLVRASRLVRAKARRRQLDRGGADLIGKDLTGADLRGANLRGASLVGADLSGADLAMADLIGADLRGADLSGADLTGSIFLTQSQLDAATGDLDTRLPPSLTRPMHWPPRGTRRSRRRPPPGPRA